MTDDELFDHVRAALAEVPYTLIGAMAMAVHGELRATLDLDLLIGDRTILEPDFLARLRTTGLWVEARRGDLGDPVAGVVRVFPRDPDLDDADTDPRIDLILLPGRWARELLGRAVAAPMRSFAGRETHVVDLADLVLLKLYAGGPRDQADIAAILARPDSLATSQLVDQRIGSLPQRPQRLWAKLRPV